MRTSQAQKALTAGVFRVQVWVHLLKIVELLAYYVQIKNGSFVCNVIGMIDIQAHKAIYFPMLYGKDMFGYGDLKFRTVIQNDEKIF